MDSTFFRGTSFGDRFRDLAGPVAAYSLARISVASSGLNRFERGRITPIG
jgi:hypothetical protein